LGLVMVQGLGLEKDREKDQAMDLDSGQAKVQVTAHQWVQEKAPKLVPEMVLD
jgi:hypothetical protein